MDIVTARGIAARIWCDQDFSHVEMDEAVAEEIAHRLMALANNQESAQPCNAARQHKAKASSYAKGFGWCCGSCGRQYQLQALADECCG